MSWRIRGTTRVFETEGEAIARAWETTAPGRSRPEVYEDTIPPPPGNSVSDWMTFNKPLKGARPDGDMSSDADGAR